MLRLPSRIPWSLAPLLLAATAALGEAQECVTASAGEPYHNSPLRGAQNGIFTAEFDATPSAAAIDATIGLSQANQTAQSGFAVLVRFNNQGRIDARNGGAYAATTAIPYAAGARFHFRLAVDVAAHRYSVFVTAEGGSERMLATDFVFRSEQAGVPVLNHWGMRVNSAAGELLVCGFTISDAPAPDCTTAAAGAGYQNRPFAAQSGRFTAEFDATPSAAGMDATVSLSNGAQTDHSGFATLVRFNNAGNVDARNGGTYAVAAPIPYAAGERIHFRLVIDVAAHRYSIFATPPGGAERTVGMDFGFRSEQSAVALLDNWGVRTNSASGSLTVCNFKISDASPPPSPSPSPSPGGNPTAAELLAKLGSCNQVSNGRFKTDTENARTIPVCQLNGAVFWRADMDIDCDGVRTTQCNENTDPFFQPDTSAHTSTGRPMNAATMPYFVIPSPSGTFNFNNFNIRLGAVAAIIFQDRVEYAVFADTGPTDIIGEASYATAVKLGINPDPANGGTDGPVAYIVFQGSRVTPIEDHEMAVSLGRQFARQFLANN